MDGMGAEVPPIPPSGFMRSSINENGWERMELIHAEASKSLMSIAENQSFI